MWNFYADVRSEFQCIVLNSFSPNFRFLPPEIVKKSLVLLKFSGGIEMEHWRDMG